jgi:hypothetical protein
VHKLSRPRVVRTTEDATPNKLFLKTVVAYGQHGLFSETRCLDFHADPPELVIIGLPKKAAYIVLDIIRDTGITTGVS